MCEVMNERPLSGRRRMGRSTRARLKRQAYPGGDPASSRGARDNCGRRIRFGDGASRCASCDTRGLPLSAKLPRLLLWVYLISWRLLPVIARLVRPDALPGRGGFCVVSPAIAPYFFLQCCGSVTLFQSADVRLAVPRMQGARITTSRSSASPASHMLQRLVDVRQVDGVDQPAGSVTG